jgi:hypothetical protein
MYFLADTSQLSSPSWRKVPDILQEALVELRPDEIVDELVARFIRFDSLIFEDNIVIPTLLDLEARC